MNATELLTELDRLGVVLEAAAGALRWRAPRGALTLELRAALAEHKPALLLHLAGAADAQAEYHHLWLRCCALDDQLQAAKEDGDEGQAARLRAELSALIDGPYTEARLRYDAALQQAPGWQHDGRR